MSETRGPEDPARRSRRPIVLALSALILAAAAVGVGVWALRRGPEPPSESSVAEYPFANTRPGVRFVGDAACVRCHEGIAASFAKHPMGRSLIPIDAAPEAIRGGPESRVLFEAPGLRYSDVRRDGRTFHRESHLDEQGHVVGAIEDEVRYVVGSGSAARRS